MTFIIFIRDCFSESISTVSGRISFYTRKKFFQILSTLESKIIAFLFLPYFSGDCPITCRNSLKLTDYTDKQRQQLPMEILSGSTQCFNLFFFFGSRKCPIQTRNCSRRLKISEPVRTTMSTYMYSVLPSLFAE